MPYIITTCWYPPDLLNEVVKVYLEALQKQPVPSYIKRVVPAAGTSGRTGLKVINVDEVKQEDMGKALDYIADFMMNFNNIKGFRYATKTYATISETLKRLGMG